MIHVFLYFLCAIKGPKTKENRGWSAFATGVRFKIVDMVHGVDSTCVQAFADELDIGKDQRHAPSQ